MITPSIKTNLILKEMGITRYELRSNHQSDLSKTIFSYQKGNILTLLEQSYDDLGEDEAKLLNAIVDAVNSVNKDTIQNKFNLEDAKKIILAMKDLKGIISFIPNTGTLDLSIPFVQSSSLNKMISDTESKKILWKKLKEIILK
jgi:DNA polymerase III psi subunit